ncbi:MAG: lipopolysaccharide transport protein LptA [Pseudohongiellaceae bacterium]|jgi:lipopolysaccharide transport protein LptA
MYSRPQIKQVLLKPTLISAIILAGHLTSTAQDLSAKPILQNVEWSADGDSMMTETGNIRTFNLLENVIVTQGTLKIVGDSAILEQDKLTRELIRVTVHGTPVSYQQQLDPDGSTVNGTSDSILLFTEDATGETVIELAGNAHIVSPDTTMDCVAIVYLPNPDLIRKATGPCTGLLSQVEE